MISDYSNKFVGSPRKGFVTRRKMTSLILTAAMIISLFAGMTLNANAATNSATLQNGGLDNVGATYNESVTAQFQNTTYVDGKAKLQFSVNFPRTEQGKMLVVIFKFAFSQNDQELTWDMIHVDGTGFSDNGKTNATREVYLYGDKTHLVNDEHNFAKYCILKGRQNSANQIYAKIFPTSTENPITFDIPLIISEEVVGDIIASVSTATCEVYDSEGGEMTYTENGNFVITSATISPASGSFNSGTLSDSNFSVPTNAGITITPSTTDLTFTVACDKACVAAIANSDGTYTRLTGTAEDNAYKFTANSADDQIVVAVKGDVSGDAKITAADYGALVAAYLGTGSLDSLNTVIGDINADDKITAADYGALVAAYLGTGTIAW